MDINLLTIGLSDILPIQPAQQISSRGPDKNDGFSDLVEKNSRISSQKEDSPSKKPAETSQTQGSGQNEAVQPSDNKPAEIQKPAEGQEVEDFENAFRNRLKSGQSQNNSSEDKPVNKTQTTAVQTSAQAKPLIQAQNNISAELNQKLSSLNNNATSSVDQSPKKAALQNAISTLQEMKQTAVQNHVAGVQNKATQQAEVTSNTSASQPKIGQEIIAKVVQSPNAQQTPGQQQVTQVESADVKQVPQNNVTIKQVPVEETGSDKPAESANQQKLNLNLESLELKTSGKDTPQQNQTKLEAYLDKDASDKIQAQIAQSRLQGEAEEVNKIRINKENKEQQGGSRKLSANTQNSAGSTQKIEKAEIFTVNNAPSKSQSESVSAQSLRGHSANINTDQAQFSASAVNANRFVNASANVTTQDNASSIREQIFQSVRASIQQGESQITIRLNPPELGQVSVRFSQRANELTGLLEATNPQTRAEIRSAIPGIIRSLEDSGVSIKRIDVMLSDSPKHSPHHQLTRDNTSPNQWEQFNQQRFNDAPDNGSSYQPYVTSAYNAQSPELNAFASASFGPDYSQPSDSSLDVLL